MLFNSLEFAIFLPLFFLLYWFVFNKHIKTQNLLIVIASYIFYGWWDWRFLILIAFTSLCSYFSGILISKSRITPPHNKYAKYIVATNIIINIGVLGYYKYLNFFIDSFNTAFSLFGSQLSLSGLALILPVGISFYTFQALSYSIDVYRSKIKPTNNIVDFFAYVSFFPQLVAGPIERATNLLPQFAKKREFDYSFAVAGCKQILWGLFLKMLVADNCAPIVNDIFTDYETLRGSTLFLGALLFTFQIYGDFAGYSYIAIGVSKLFGFNLMTNFNYPYLSRDIAEFWRRWHISLSSWFRDYLYIPLGGSRGGKWLSLRNTLIIFIVSGFWHGANWTFVIWGLYHGLLFIPLLLTNKNRKNLNIVAENKIFPTVKEFLQVISTFILVVFGWIFFRAEDISKAILYIQRIFTTSLFSIPDNILETSFTLLFIFIMVLVEWSNRGKEFGLAYISTKVWVRYSVYIIIGLFIIIFAGKDEAFIYFQF